MPVLSLTGQDLVDGANAKLQGYQNAIDPDDLLKYLNEGKDHIWAVLKELEDGYFGQESEWADATQPNYFGPIDPSSREWPLPPDFRNMTAVEVVPGLIVPGNSGFEQAIFTYKRTNSQEWKAARRSANVDRTLGPTVEYFYTLFGKNKFILAQYPETTLQLQLFYTRWILDFEMEDTLDEVLLPFSKKLEDFAVKRVMLGVQDQAQFDRWTMEWKESLKTVEASADPRNEADPTFVDDFIG